MPNFRLNLFLQAKRSYYYQRRPRHLRKLLSAAIPCWRFDLDQAQQEALEKVAAKLGDRAVVTYAAPAFHRISQLNAHTVHGTILSHSTFPRVENLSGHTSWYYTNPGGSGYANSEPIQIEGIGLEQWLASVTEGKFLNAEGTVSEQLGILGGIIERTIQTEVSDDNPRKALFFERIRQIEPLAQSFEGMGESAQSFLRVAAFATTFNLDWYAIG